MDQHQFEQLITKMEEISNSLSNPSLMVYFTPWIIALGAIVVFFLTRHKDLGFRRMQNTEIALTRFSNEYSSIQSTMISFSDLRNTLKTKTNESHVELKNLGYEGALKKDTVLEIESIKLFPDFDFDSFFRTGTTLNIWAIFYVKEIIDRPLAFRSGFYDIFIEFRDTYSETIVNYEKLIFNIEKLINITKKHPALKEHQNNWSANNAFHVSPHDMLYHLENFSSHIIADFDLMKSKQKEWSDLKNFPNLEKNFPVKPRNKVDKVIHNYESY